MRQEHQSSAVRSRRRQRERDRLAKKAIRHLNEDAGAVAGIRIGSARPAMFEVDQEVERRADDGVRARAFDVGDKPHTTRVVFVSGAVQALRPLVTVFHVPIKRPAEP